MEMDDLLACPVCQGELSSRGQQFYYCPGCQRGFPPMDGIVDLTSERLPSFQRFSEIESIQEIEAKVMAAQVFYHDRLGSGYDHHWTTSGIFSSSTRSRVKNIVTYASELAGNDVALDIGTGTGHVLAHLHRHFGRALGIDLSIEMLKVCNERGLTSFRADGCGLPFRSNSVNFVTAFSVVHHVVHPEKLFLEILRILKPGGILYTDWDQNRIFPQPLLGVWMMTYRPLRTLFGGILRRLVRDEMTLSFELAEYHPFRGFLDGEEMQELLLSTGFSEAKVFYHINRGTPFDREVPSVDVKELRQNLRLRHLLPIFMLVARKGPF